jgi:glutamyl-tRNA synthetase
VYAHLPTVLNERGEKMSKRNGAKPVTQFRDEGYLADAVVNYLARLGWSHGDAEIFSREQFLQWFDLDHLGKSAAQFDEAKLRWVNAQHMKADARQRPGRAGGAAPAQAAGVTPDERLPRICAAAQGPLRHHGGAGRVGLALLPAVQHASPTKRPSTSPTACARPSACWPRCSRAALGQGLHRRSIKEVLRATGLKMPQLAMPVRVLVLGTAQTPSLDAVLELLASRCRGERLAKA